MSGASPARPPSVDAVLRLLREEVEWSEAPALADLVREAVDEQRAAIAAGAEPLTDRDLAAGVAARILRLIDPHVEGPPPVVNATGVILHTNLGRAPWPRAARIAATVAAAGYGYLELDEVTGRRGPRFRVAEEHLVALTGAEDALVVTNNAAALLLAVGLVGRRGGVAVSRGELVEIGGGVRIPEVVSRAGARLVEVGTTNRTRAADFAAPLADGRATAVLRVHPSNFAMSGFTESADPAEVAALAHAHDAIVIDDLGSGALLDTESFGLAHEPTPRERLAAGADVVLFSGDKLVGGPQAGLVVGRLALVARMRRDPLARAMRPDKAILAGVATTLALYRAGRARLEIPVWQLIAREPAALRRRATWIVGRVPGGDAPAARVVELRSPVGGGSLPGQTLPSFGIAVRCASPARAVARLRRQGTPRAGDPDARDRPPVPVLARVEDDEVVFDLRTVEPADDGLLEAAVGSIAGRG